jgi:hypothetical protein
MDDFIKQWSGHFEDHLVQPPSDHHVEPNPLGAFADDETEASCSPLSPQVADEDVFMAPTIIPTQKYDGTKAPKSPSIKAPQTPPIPPWRKAGLASVASSSRAAPNQVQPKQMPATVSAERAASSQASTSAVKPAASSQAATSSVAPAASETDATVDEALLAYRAAEAAVNNCAKESLFGPYNEAYYRVETKVAIEKAISWRDRGPREKDPADQPKYWKSQRWRENSKRYSNRGGKSKEYFAKKYAVRPETSTTSSATQSTEGR